VTKPRLKALIAVLRRCRRRQGSRRGGDCPQPSRPSSPPRRSSRSSSFLLPL
jgi:hypothetical protein